MEKPLRVLSIFNDFFGENNIDMQGYLSLDRFKSWMRVEPISTYILNNRIADITPNDWNMYSELPIFDLPESLATQVANSFNNGATWNGVIGNKIGNAKFDDIFILIHFPHVRVTNEHDRYVDINDLWAKVILSYNGTMNGRFALNRSKYTMLHIRSNYMHSHVRMIPFGDFSQFQIPCTGSGPINDTMISLHRDYDEDIWNMFCLELSKYVTVESISGVPYHYLERLGTDDMDEGINRFTTYLSLSYFDEALSISDLKKFIEYFIKSKKLKFNYINGSFSIGMSFIEFIVLISNEFIEWYNNQFNEGNVTSSLNELKRCNILKECIIDNGKIYYGDSTNNSVNYSQYIGEKVCVFKGKEVTVNITDIEEVKNDNKSLVLNAHIALYILTIILKVLNYRYGRSKATHKDNQIGTEVRYL